MSSSRWLDIDASKMNFVAISPEFGETLKSASGAVLGFETDICFEKVFENQKKTPNKYTNLLLNTNL